MAVLAGLYLTCFGNADPLGSGFRAAVEEVQQRAAHDPAFQKRLEDHRREMKEQREAFERLQREGAP